MALEYSIILQYIYLYMKTTIDIADGLYQQMKEIAAREQTTLRALLEEGLVEALLKHQTPHQFTFSPVTFKGTGLNPDMASASWEEIRSLSYKGRGT